MIKTGLIKDQVLSAFFGKFPIIVWIVTLFLNILSRFFPRHLDEILRI
jgi:hypothetical protein